MISFMIPIYKAEEHLALCLDSLLFQTVSDWEAILIDDGSPDSSGEICDAYVARDKRFIAIHQPNGGVSAARNAGLDNARGEYVAFVDADDRLAPDFLEKMLAAMGEGVDLVFCNYLRVSPEEETLYTSSYSEKLAALLKKHSDRVFPREDRALAALWAAGVLSACHSKLYRRALLTERFDGSLSFAEDSLFVAGAALRAEAIAYVEEPLYRYLYREGSLSAGWWSGMLTQRSRSLTAIAERFAEAGCPLAERAAKEMRDGLNPEEFLTQISDRRRALELLKEYCALPNYPEMLAVIASTRSRLTCLVYKIRSPRLLRAYLSAVLKRRG
ncbi:MAG: glycosyltransferase [Clostridia bacterium]|nr:glycosyltransferase [Clostridia bacterium]